ncbi:MAG: hypothetical protein ABI426_05180, partial [Flavobacterium sp.]
FVGKTVFTQPLLDTLINTICGTVVFFIIGKKINQKTRLIDILTTCLIARTPSYLLTFLNINGFINNATSKILTQINPEKLDNIPTIDLGILMITGIITIPILVWFFVLLYNGFKTATNAKETKHTFLFILGIIITEIITKILIKQLI